MKKKRITQFAIATVIGVAIIGGTAYALSNQSANFEELYEVAVAEQGDIVNEMKFSGIIEPNDSRSIYYVVSGKVTDVNVKDGDLVKAGDELVKLDSTVMEYDIQAKELALQQLQIDQQYALKETSDDVSNLNEAIGEGSQDEILTAQQAVFSAQDAYQKATRDYNIALTQYQNETTASILDAKQALKVAENEHAIAKDNDLDNEVSRQGVSVTNARQNLEQARVNARLEVEQLKETMDTAEGSMIDAKNKYDSTLRSIEQTKVKLADKNSKQAASLAVAQAQVELEREKRQLEDYTIKAPIGGYVTDLDVKVGNSLGESKALMKIQNFDSMKVKCKVDEYHLLSLSEGQEVQVYVNSLDKTYDGKVSKIASSAVSDGGYSYVEVYIDFTPDQKISSGLGAQISIIKDSTEGVLCVPLEAVSYDETTFESYVQVAENGKLVHKTVETGASDDSKVAILSGLSEGDTIYYE